MTKTMMRVDKDLLLKLKAKKLVENESYANVVKRMIDNEVKLDYSHDAVIGRLKAQAGKRWNRTKGRAGKSLGLGGLGY